MGKKISTMAARVVFVLFLLSAAVLADELVSLDSTAELNQLGEVGPSAGCAACVSKCKSEQCKTYCQTHHCAKTSIPQVAAPPAANLTSTPKDAKAAAIASAAKAAEEVELAQAAKKAVSDQDEKTQASLDKLKSDQKKSAVPVKGVADYKALDKVDDMNNKADVQKKKAARKDKAAFDAAADETTQADNGAVKDVKAKWTMVRKGGVQTAVIASAEVPTHSIKPAPAVEAPAKEVPAQEAVPAQEHEEEPAQAPNNGGGSPKEVARAVARTTPQQAVNAAKAAFDQLP